MRTHRLFIMGLPGLLASLALALPLLLQAHAAPGPSEHGTENRSRGIDGRGEVRSRHMLPVVEQLATVLENEGIISDKVRLNTSRASFGSVWSVLRRVLQRSASDQGRRTESISERVHPGAVSGGGIQIWHFPRRVLQWSASDEGRNKGTVSNQFQSSNQAASATDRGKVSQSNSQHQHFFLKKRSPSGSSSSSSAPAPSPCLSFFLLSGFKKQLLGKGISFCW